MVKALGNKKTIGKSYNIPGLRAISMNRVVDTVSRLLGRRVYKVHLPASPFVRVLEGLERFGMFLPIKSEQILRLNEDKVFSYEDATLDFGYAPLSFEEGIRREIVSMGWNPQICAD